MQVTFLTLMISTM